MSIYKDCDIRGVYGVELRDEDGYRVGRALATLKPGGAFRVGGDVRLSTPAFKAELIRGLAQGGARVADMGEIATPVMYFALAHSDADGGVMVTASHNPAQYNGLKFMLGDRPVTRQTIDAIESAVRLGAYTEGAGSVRGLSILPEYLSSLRARFQAVKPLKVVVDAGNGAMSRIAPQALGQSGYEVVELFCTPDGSFPNRTPNPSEYDQLTALQAKVTESQADYGVAFDGDGDRAVFVDDQGEVVLSERSLTLFIRYLLKDAPTPVVYDQKSSSVVRKAVLEMGGEPIPERSGHTFIKRRFLDLGAAVAGEVSGHFFFRELGYDDGLFAALLMGEIIGRHGALSALLKDVICPPITPDLRLRCPYDKQDEALARIEVLGAGHRVTHMDGVRIDYGNAWLLARKSVTAEQLTLRAEADSQEALQALLKSAGRALAPILPEAETLA